MSRVILKMPAKHEAEDAARRKLATPQHITLAWLLQRSAGVRMDEAQPAPLYLAQAYAFLSEENFQEDLFRAIWPGHTKS